MGLDSHLPILGLPQSFFMEKARLPVGVVEGVLEVGVTSVSKERVVDGEGKTLYPLLSNLMAATIYLHQFLFLLSISLILHKSISYPATSSSIINPAKVKQVSSKPRAFVYKGFLTDLECDHLISLAKSELKRSAVADNENGKSKLSEVRTSSGMFITKAKDPIVAGIEDKIATWTFLPKVR
ncbi:hypothetical protein OIU76_014506 [Salix suchowensis]|nr:hypothetical protein OIU76_014506 [Salix suchowensis]